MAQPDQKNQECLNETMSVRNKVFISYAHKDAKWKDKFVQMLLPVKDTLTVWSDEDIQPGTDWQSAIEQELRSASIALLLVSPNFLASTYIEKIEIREILTRHQTEGLKIHWVPLSAALTEHTPLNPLQAAWDPKYPLHKLSKPNQEEAIKVICQKLLSDAGQLVRLSDARRNRLTCDVEEVIRKWNIKLDKPIGSGEFAVIYKGVMDETQVIVKALIDSPIRGHIEGLAQEIKRIKSLTHPCFSRLEHTDLENEPQCLVLEYVDAPTVEGYMKQIGKAFSEDEVIILIRRLAQALQEYHAKEMLYGIMASNDVYYDKDRGQLRMPAVNFSSRLSLGGPIAGDFPRDRRAATYLIPERYAGDPYTKQSDQYSLALLAVEMLLGKVPVLVKSASDMEDKRRFFDAPGQFISNLESRHPGLAKVLLRMLQKAPVERYETMKEVADALVRQEPTARIIAKQSYRKYCMGKTDFYREFYERFFRVCPETRQMFTSIEQQYEKLDQALHALLNFADQDMTEPTVLTTTATTHQARGIAPAQLERFADCLIETLREVSKESGIALAAWQAVLHPGIDYMKKRANTSDQSRGGKQADQLFVSA